MRLLFILISLLSAPLLRSQSFSHVNLIGGYHYYNFTQRGDDTRLEHGPRLGAGISYFITSSSYSRLEYNAVFFQEDYNLRYVNGPNFSGTNFGFRNTVLQNQFLFIVTGGLNWINFKMGLDWDVVLNRKELGDAGDMPDSDVIFTAEGDKFSDHNLNFHLAMMVNFKQRISFGFNAIVGITDWYTAGTPVFDPYDYDFAGQGVRKSTWALTINYWLFKDPEDLID